jgi:hypothetical protein
MIWKYATYTKPVASKTGTDNGCASATYNVTNYIAQESKPCQWADKKDQESTT